MGNKWIRGGCIAAAFFMAAVLLVGAGEIAKINHVPHWVHRVEHFFYYGLMAFLLAYGLGRRWFWIALLAVALFGALDEWHQFYVPGRSSSAWDWLTDTIAAGAGLFLYWRVAIRKRTSPFSASTIPAPRRG